MYPLSKIITGNSRLIFNVNTSVVLSLASYSLFSLAFSVYFTTIIGTLYANSKKKAKNQMGTKTRPSRKLEIDGH